MADFIVFTMYWVFLLIIVIAILNAIWKNIGCIFIGVMILLVSLIMFKSFGMHF